MKKTLQQQKRKERLSKLINACLEHFTESEMIEAFNEETNEEYELKKGNEKMISELEYEGYTITKFDSLVQEWKFNDFMEQLKENPYQLTLVA